MAEQVPTGEFAHWRLYSALVVDDEEGMRRFLERALAGRCASVAAAGSVEDAEELMRRQYFDLVILDIALPGKSGVEWLHELRERGFSGDVVLITAYADLDTAIDALRAGASDFLLKPFSLAQMLNAVKRCFDRSRLARENYVLRREVQELAAGDDRLVGRSEPTQRLCELLRRIAPTPSTVLIQGESGTGKEVVARVLHRLSPRAQGPFVPINCAAMSPEIIESELFGHVKGAYTGASGNREGLFFYARGGTLFLDEISELPLPLQAKLLRVLEERRVRPLGSETEIPVDVRIIAATNRHLAQEVAEHRFRQDLFYRLQVVEVNLPPLRERREDIPDLVAHFLAQIGSQLGFTSIAPDAEMMRLLQASEWPGNVRELRNSLERSLILGGFHWARGPSAPSERPKSDSLEDMERQHVRSVLAAASGNKSEAARRLKISRKTLERKCQQWGI
ncbi:Regulatory protein AtoC [Burkholderiales bacterium]|nr:Regulatory protein AtoC [Burkholderiales bacterium]